MGWGELLLRPLPLPALWASGKSCLGACAAAAVPAVRKTETFKPCYLPDICPGVGLNLKKYVLVAQLCLTLCDPMNYRPPGSSVHGILQARILEWVAISFFRGSFRSRNRTQASCTAGRVFTDWARREALPSKPPGKPLEKNRNVYIYIYITLLHTWN